MPRSSSSVETVSHYSRFTGWIYIFNLIVGTGALTLPAAFHDAGWLPSTVIIILLAFISYLTATFVIESMASANALMHHRRLQRFKKSSHSEQPEVNNTAGGSTEVRIVPAEESSDSGRASPSNFHYVGQQTDDESEPLLSDTSDINLQRHGYSDNRPLRSENETTFYDITEIFEMGKMASLFFNKTGRFAFYLCLIIYLYGDLAIYGAAVAKSLRDVMCTYTPFNTTKSSKNISEDELCWENSDLDRFDAYRVALAGFIVLLGPFTFFNVTKTKYLQLLTTIMRWLAFGVMITLAGLRLSKGKIFNPPVSDFSGVPNLFGVCVYSFMCHHSLPSLVTPISRKRGINALVFLDYFVILLFYFLLAFTGIFAFEEINDLYTLNFQPEPDEAWYMKVIHYFLSLFPVFTLSTNFPIIAITLRNNLKTLFLTEGRMYSWCTRKVVFPLMALIPPVVLALATNSLEFLVGITGSYAGAGIQYVVPALLAYSGRKATVKAIGVGVKNHHQSWFQSTIWIVLVNLWALGCIVLVTWNHISQAINKGQL